MQAKLSGHASDATTPAGVLSWFSSDLDGEQTVHLLTTLEAHPDWEATVKRSLPTWDIGLAHRPTGNTYLVRLERVGAALWRPSVWQRVQDES